MANATAEKPVEKEKPLSKSSLSGFEFAIEIDTKRNGDVLLQAIPGARLRGAIDASKPIIASPDQKHGKFMATIPADQAAGLGALPKIPGMVIRVHPDKKTYQIIDPLYDTEELCNQIVSALKSKGQESGKINGVAPLAGTLSTDRMKNLCRELRWIVEANDGRVVEGSLPSLEEIDIMEGDYLLNPGAITPSMQPQHEKDFDGWVQRLAQGGG